MYRMMRWFSLSLAFMVLVLSACSSSQPAAKPAGAQAPIKIAWLLDKSGPTAEFGSLLNRGVELAVNAVNSGGGINGRQVQLVVEDTAGDKTQAVALLRKQAADPSVVAVLGPMRTPEVLAASPVADELKLLILSPASAGAWPGEMNPWTFRTGASSDQVLPWLAKAVVDKLGKKKAVLFAASDDDYSVAAAKLWTSSAKAVGLEIVDTQTYRVGNQDFSAQITKIKPLAPDVILMAGLTREAALIAKEAKAQGLNALMVGESAGLGDPVTLQDLSQGAAEGTVVAQVFNPGKDDPKVKAYVANLKEKFNTAPAYDVYGYDAASTLLDAIKRVQGPLTRQSVRDALGATKNFPGLTGSLSWSNSGDVIRSEFILTVLQNKQYVPRK